MYIDNVLSINDLVFKNYISEVYPIDIEIKTHERQQEFCSKLYLLLRSVETVNITTLPFTTNVTILNPYYKLSIPN